MAITVEPLRTIRSCETSLMRSAAVSVSEIVFFADTLSEPFTTIRWPFAIATSPPLAASDRLPSRTRVAAPEGARAAPLPSEMLPAWTNWVSLVEAKRTPVSPESESAPPVRATSSNSTTWPSLVTDRPFSPWMRSSKRTSPPAPIVVSSARSSEPSTSRSPRERPRSCP